MYFRTHTYTHLGVASRMWVLCASTPMEGFPTLSRRLPMSWKLHVVPCSNSNANLNKTQGNLIPGSAKKSPPCQKQYRVSVPPSPQRPMLAATRVFLALRKKVRSCRPFDPLAACQHWTSGEGGKLWCQIHAQRIFFADPGTPRRGAGGHVMAKALNASAYATAEKGLW